MQFRPLDASAFKVFMTWKALVASDRSDQLLRRQFWEGGEASVDTGYRNSHPLKYFHQPRRHFETRVFTHLSLLSVHPETEPMGFRTVGRRCLSVFFHLHCTLCSSHRQFLCLRTL